MLGQLESAGGQTFFGKALTGIFAADEADAAPTNNVRLAFADGSEVSASRVLFNIPRNALEALDPASLLFQKAANTTCEYLGDVAVNHTVKVFAIYEDAWWNRILGLVQGTFTDLTDVAPLQGPSWGAPQVAVRRNESSLRPSARHAGAVPGAEVLPFHRGCCPLRSGQQAVTTTGRRNASSGTTPQGSPCSAESACDSGSAPALSR